MRSTMLAVLVSLCVVGIVGMTMTGAAVTPQPAEVDRHQPVIESPVTTAQLDDHVHDCAAEPPDDFADPEGNTSEVVGWVDGYWYAEPLEITDSTLTPEELDELVLRTAARVEALRCLTFEEVPPVEIITREEYRDELESDFEDLITDDDVAFDNAQLATLLIAGQSVDAIELQLENQAAFPAAFYDTEDEYMGFVVEDPDTIEVQQVTLAHELVHALQDQHVELETIFDEPTNDGFIASLAVVEGDAVLTDGMYEANCDAGAWVDDCLVQPPGPQPDVPSWALTLNQLAAYQMPLVEQTYEQDGWDGVNALLEEMPNSTVETMYPERYGEFERTPIAIADRSSPDWERIERADANEGVLGQHALTAILMAPLYETGGQVEIIDRTAFVDPATGEISNIHPATDGWEADRFYGYTDAAGNTAGVWKLAWENGDEADTFADAFVDLAEYRGATLADNYENVYTFDESDEYDMALGIERTDDRIWIVTAPSVEELTAVHGDFEAVEVDDGGPEPVDDDRADDVDPGSDDDDSADDDSADADDDTPGFGVVVAIVAALAGGLVFAHVRRA